MSHLRTQIRQRIVTNLTGLNTTGSNVYDTRVYPLAPNKLPGLAVYTKSENIDYETMSPPRTLRRTLTAVIEIYVKMTSTFDEVLDTIASEVETALYGDLTQNGLAFDTKVVSFEADFGGDAEQPLGQGIIEVEVTYAATEGSPEG